MSAQPPYIPERWTFEDDTIAAARRVLRSLPNPDTATREVKT